MKSSNSEKAIITVAKRVEKPTIDNLKNWMEENKIASGINIDEDSKRTYPYENLASNIIGFYGSDKGLEGIEAAWDNELSGTPGRIITTTNRTRETKRS